MLTMNVSRNKFSKPINIPSLKSDQLKAKLAFIPTMSFITQNKNVWDVRKNTHGGEWKKKSESWSEEIYKSVQNEWNTEKDLVRLEHLEDKLRTELERIVPLLQNDWYTQFEEPDNSGCNSMYPSDDENDNDSSILDICQKI